MKATPLAIPDVVLLEPRVMSDERGCFYESFNHARLEKLLGRTLNFVQDNHSHSVQHVVRGLHYQLHQPQAKLVRIIAGSVLDVAVDLRHTSPSFGQWVSVVLSAENRQQLWIPEGFAHGFAVLSPEAQMLYKTTDYWLSTDERCIAWDDPTLAIRWPDFSSPLLSSKDLRGLPLTKAEVFV